MIVSELFDTMMNSNSDDEEPKMSRLLRLAQKFNCFYLNGKCCCADPVVGRISCPFSCGDAACLPRIDCIKSIAAQVSAQQQMLQIRARSAPELKLCLR